jgi:integrase
MPRTTSRKRPNGDGSIYRDQTRGGWVGEVLVDGRRRRVRGRDKTEVSAKLRRLVAEAESGTLSADRTLTVAATLDRFVSRSVPNRRGGALAPSTRNAHRWAADLISAEIGTKRLHALTTRDVELMLDRLASRPTSPLARGTLVKVRSTLRMALHEAMKRREVAYNVAAFAELPGDLPPARERQALTPAEALRLLDELRSERNGAMYGLMLRLGLRPGEAGGLHWEDLSAGTLNVTRGLQRDRGRVRVADTLKTTSSKRTIELPPDVASWLVEHRYTQVGERLAAAVWNDDRLMFATPAGSPVDASKMRKQLAAVCRRAEVTVVTPNELRHSCASLLADQGVPHERIADLLGHTTTRMVDTTYRHRLRPSISVAVEADWRTAATETH